MDRDRLELPALVKVYPYQCFHVGQGQYLAAGCYATLECIVRCNESIVGAKIRPWLPIEAESIEIDPAQLEEGFYYKPVVSGVVP